MPIANGKTNIKMKFVMLYGNRSQRRKKNQMQQNTMCQKKSNEWNRKTKIVKWNIPELGWKSNNEGKELQFAGS